MIDQTAITYQTVAARPSLRTAAVMDRFGIDFETEPVVVASSFALPLPQPCVVAFTGESGSGKSTLMRHAAAALDGPVVDLDALDLGERPLVDRLGGRVDDAIALLSKCGLAEARLMLRRPSELSEGQRYRFRLALAVDTLLQASGDNENDDGPAGWIVADEFTATLDRTLACVIARSVHRLVDAHGCGLLIATTHDDILPDLQPDVHVRCTLDGEPMIERL